MAIVIKGKMIWDIRSFRNRLLKFCCPTECRKRRKEALRIAVKGLRRLTKSLLMKILGHGIMSLILDMAELEIKIGLACGNVSWYLESVPGSCLKKEDRVGQINLRSIQVMWSVTMWKWMEPPKNLAKR